MNVLKIIAWIFVVAYGVIILLFYLLQTKLIFFPGVLNPDFKFELGTQGKEHFIETPDGAAINALFFKGSRPEVILYFHGNAGNISTWQFVSDDFRVLGFNFMIIDYRGYGKSTGKLSENGLYQDGDAGYNFLLQQGFTPENIIVYGRSIGTGIAVDVAARRPCKGLILESPFFSLGKLANEKLPFFFPSLYIRYSFDNAGKINAVKCPVLILHGSADTLIPISHAKALYEKFSGKKKMITVDGGAHNDLHTFNQYAAFMKDELPAFFQ